MTQTFLGGVRLGDAGPHARRALRGVRRQRMRRERRHWRRIRRLLQAWNIMFFNWTKTLAVDLINPKPRTLFSIQFHELGLLLGTDIVLNDQFLTSPWRGRNCSLSTWSMTPLPGRGAQRTRSAARKKTRSRAAAQWRAAAGDSSRAARPAHAVAVVWRQPLSSSATRTVPGFFYELLFWAMEKRIFKLVGY